MKIAKRRQKKNSANFLVIHASNVTLNLIFMQETLYSNHILILHLPLKDWGNLLDLIFLSPIFLATILLIPTMKAS